MNNLLEFGGSGQLIATAICDFSVQDTYFFKKDDIVFDFDSIHINFNYNYVTGEAKSDKTNLFYEKFYIDSLSLDVVPFDNNFKLFCNNDLDYLTICEVENCVAVNNNLFLKNAAIDDSIKIDGIYNFNAINVGDFTLITSEDLVDNNVYKVYYNRQIKVKSIFLDNEEIDIPYLKLQIKFRGNNDKEEVTSYIIIPKASIRLTPVFNLQNNSVSHIRINAKVINDEEKPVLSVV